MVKAYQQYKDKNFTIIGISLDKDKEKWLKAIADDQLTWTHLSDLKYWDSEIPALYGVRGIPANVLLDPEGIATPTIRNETDRNRGSIQVRYIDKYGNSDYSTGYPIVNVPARDVEIRFEGIVDNFVMQEFD